MSVAHHYSIKHKIYRRFFQFLQQPNVPWMTVNTKSIFLCLKFGAQWSIGFYSPSWLCMRQWIIMLKNIAVLKNTRIIQCYLDRGPWRDFSDTLPAGKVKDAWSVEAQQQIKVHKKRRKGSKKHYVEEKIESSASWSVSSTSQQQYPDKKLVKTEVELQQLDGFVSSKVWYGPLYITTLSSIKEQMLCSNAPLKSHRVCPWEVLRLLQYWHHTDQSPRHPRIYCLSPPVHLHGGLICITFCLPVCNLTKIQTRQKFISRKVS